MEKNQNFQYQKIDQEEQNQVDEINTDYLMQKILGQKISIQQQTEQKNIQDQLSQIHPQKVRLKRLEIRMDDIRLYNSKWISRLCQMETNAQIKTNFTQQSFQDNNKIFQQEQSKEQQDKCYLRTSLNFPQWFEQLFTIKGQNLPQFQLQVLFKQQMLSRTKKLKMENIFLLVQYHAENVQLQKFLHQSINQPEFSINSYSINYFLNSQQLNIISENFNQFQTYVRSKSINELFLVKEIKIDQIFCHQNSFCHLEEDNQSKLLLHKTNLLQKIIAIRKLLRYIEQKTHSNKSIIIKDSSSKLSQSFYQTHTKYNQSKIKKQLYGNKLLIDQLLTLYGQQTNPNTKKLLIQTSKLNQTNLPKWHLKFVQFVPKLDINQNNYNKFLAQVSEIKKTFFNGISVGFQGFRISNFTTRSQNNITFVFHQFHQLVQLQSLLIDFQFPLNYIEQIKKQYVQFPSKKLKKIKIKFHVAQKSKKSNQSMGYYPENYNQKLDSTKNPLFAFEKNVSFMQKNEKKAEISSNRLMNSTMMNSSFFLEPSGYYERIQQRSTFKEYLKEFYFYKLDKDSPDYQRLIKHINSLSSVSKTLIMKFECIFPLIKLRHSLSQLINICSDFSPTELHILPQPLQLVKLHEDYRSSLVTLKEQVRQLLENEDKFGCLSITRSGMKVPTQRLNSINCYNMVKVRQDYLMNRQLFKKIHKQFQPFSRKDQPIYNSQFEQIAGSIQFLLPYPKPKNEFICFPFHNRTFKIVKYFEPGTMNLLDLQLKETNQRSENFLPVQEITLNQYKTKMIKQGLDFFYYSYPFGQKFKLSLHNHHIYSLTLKNQLKFNKLDHLRILYWLGKLNKIQNKIVFYQNALLKPYLSEEDKKKYFAQTFIKQKLPSFDNVYDIGFVDDYLKSKIVQIQVFSSNQNKQKPNLIFKKAIEKFALEGSNANKSQKFQSYKIKTNRATWDLVLKKLRQICNEKQNQLRKLTGSQQDDKQFERLKNSLKKTSN